MQTLTLADSPALANSKKLICRGILGCIISLFCLFIPLVNLIALFSIIAFWIVGVVGLYRFSKLADAFVYRDYVYALLLNLGYFIVLQILAVVVMNDVMMPSTSVYVACAIVLLGGIAVMALQVYWFYKASVELAFLSGLKAFMASFKLYVVALVGNVLVGAISGFMFVDFLNHNPLVVSGMIFGGLEYGLIAFFKNYLSLLIVWGLLCVVTLASVVFFCIGFFSITRTFVRPREALKSTDYLS